MIAFKLIRHPLFVIFISTFTFSAAVLSSDAFSHDKKIITLALNAEERGDLVWAEKWYRELRLNDLPPLKYPDIRNNFAILLLEKGDQNSLEEAENLIKKLVHTGNASTLNLLGLIMRKKGGRANEEMAERYYRRAIKAGSCDARANLAAMLHDGRKDEAIIHYRIALASGLTAPVIKINFANLLLEKGDQSDEPEAERLLRQALAAGYRPALNALGHLIAKKGGHKSLRKGERLFRLAVADGDIPALSNLGKILLQMGGSANLAEAELLMRKFVENRPEDAAAMNGLGTVLAQKNDPESWQEAERLLLQAIEKNNQDARFNLGIVLLKTGNRADASIHFRVSADAGFSPAFLYLAASLPSTAAAEKDALYVKALELGVPDADALYAKFLLDHQDNKKAEDLEDFIEFNSAVDEPKENNVSSAEDAKESPSPIKPSSAAAEGPEENETPPISKRRQKIFERAKRAEENLIENALLLTTQDKRRHRTFKNVVVTIAHPDVALEIEKNESKTKTLLSYLANAEKRARLEPLAHFSPSLYSMRFNQADRLVFKISSGDLKDGVTGVHIISAESHYDTLAKRLKMNTVLPYAWAEGK